MVGQESSKKVGVSIVAVDTLMMVADGYDGDDDDVIVDELVTVDGALSILVMVRGLYWYHSCYFDDVKS